MVGMIAAAPAPENHHPQCVGDVFSTTQAVEDGGSADNCCAVLDRRGIPEDSSACAVSVQYRNTWRFNVFEVDAAEGWFSAATTLPTCPGRVSSNSNAQTHNLANF